MRTTPLFVRIAGAFAGACVIVVVLSLIGAGLIRLWDDDRGSEDDLTAHPVSLLVGYDSVDIAELLGEPRYQLPDLEPPPPLPAPEPREPRRISGFVMVEVLVDAEGRATDARVIDAAPAGIYEREAVAEALAGRYEAGVPGRRDTVVRFSVPVEDTSR